MTKINSFSTFFTRERRPGDLVFAVLFLAFSLFLLSQLGDETKWIKGTKLFVQPSFWPTISIAGMCLFALGHLLGSVFSNKPGGRAREVLLWIRSIEYALWFMAYVWIVPVIGYLPSTLIFIVLLILRVGYREKSLYVSGLLMGVAIVVVFKAFLSVKIPGGQIYEHLPDGIRNFMLLYL